MDLIIVLCWNSCP